MLGSQRQLQIILQLKDEASKELRRFREQVQLSDTNTKQWEASLAFAKKSLIALGTASAGFIGYGVKVAADLQTARVGLETLLGSAEEAEATLVRLKREAARTPFELPGLTQATQLLTSVTKDGDKSIDILLDVGEALAAMGKGQSELDRIIVNLQQIAATGRAATIDIRQFAFAGIPIYEMLTETTGKSGEALEELIQSGGVTFDLLTQMFDEANDAGGRFFGAFENQSGTFNQAFSNMKDSVGILAAEFVTTTGILDGFTKAMMDISTVLSRRSIEELLLTLESKTGLVSDFVQTWVQVKEALIPLQPMFTELAKLTGGALVVALKAVLWVIRETITGWSLLLQGAQKVSDAIVGPIYNAWVKFKEPIEQILDIVKKVIKAFERLSDFMPVGSIVKAFRNVIPGRATGGTVTASRPYMVGERGPELFVPNTSGTVVPNGRLAAAGGATINVSINGGYFLSEDVAEQIGDSIISRLGMTTKFAS